MADVKQCDVCSDLFKSRPLSHQASIILEPKEAGCLAEKNIPYYVDIAVTVGDMANHPDLCLKCLYEVAAFAVEKLKEEIHG